MRDESFGVGIKNMLILQPFEKLLNPPSSPLFQRGKTGVLKRR